jgi:hypothetical protein
MFLCSNFIINHVKCFNVLFLLILLVVPCVTAAGINGSLDAGGFAGESFVWNYYFYLSGVVSASTNDSAHIKWDGLNATMTYPSAGDWLVRFTFRTSGGTNYSGTGRIRIVEKEEWIEKPRIDWNPQFVMSDFRQGTVDYAKTEAAAKALNVNGVATLVCGSYSVMEGLLNNTDLYVWPIIYGRNHSLERNCIFGDDYDSWAVFFANMSLKYKNLQAFIIDDFHPTKSSNDLFTPSYVLKFMQAKNRINPNLRFIPVLYFDSSAGDELDYYRSGNPYKTTLADGGTMWYWGSYRKLYDAATFDAYLKDAHQTIRPKASIIGIYPIAYSQSGESMYYGKSTVSDLVAAAVEESDGVHVFAVPLWIHDLGYVKENATIFRQLVNNNPSFSYRLGVASGYGTFSGWYQGIVQNLSLPSVISSANISFQVKDSRGISDDYLGYHFKQLLVNGVVLWDADASSDSTDTLAIKKDLKGHLAGSKAQITIRLYDKISVGNMPVDMYVGNISIYVNGVRVANNWSYVSDIESNYTRKLNETFYSVSGALAKLVPPEISFTGATPVNDAVISPGLLSINLSSTDGQTAGTMTSLLDWNNSLIGWYRFNDEVGETSTLFRDWSGSKNNGRCSGSACPVTSSGRFGSALLFDGVNDVVNISDPSEDLSGNLTIEFWIKPSNIGVTRINPLDKSYWGEFAFTIETNGRLSYYHGQNKSNYTSFISLSAATIINNSWQHVVLTRDADAKVLRSYYNGVLKNTAAYAIDPSRTGNPILMGDGYASPFKGSIDEVRIFDRVLSPQEIRASYNSALYVLSADFSSIPCGTYAYKAYTQDSDGNAASSELRSVILSSTTTSTSTTTTSSTTSTTMTTSSSTTSTSTTTSSISSSSTTSTLSTTTTSTTSPQCVMPGNSPPCDEVSLSEAVEGIYKWVGGIFGLGEVIDLINSWADPAVYIPQ